MNKNRGDRTETIVMPFKGVIPSGISYLGWRQSSYAYSYQVQYMVKARMVPDKQLETGTETTKTGWKYPNSKWSGDVNTFNKCVTMDKEHRYYRYFGFGGKSLMTKGSYDKLDVVVRVRSFNSKKKQHGTWITNTLTVKCRPDVKVHKIVALADGGIQIYLNTGGWKRGDSQVILHKVRRSGWPDANSHRLDQEVGAIGTEEASGYPYAEFPGKYFRYDFEEGRSITLKNCYFRTCDGVDVSLDGTYNISTIDADISSPKVEVTRGTNAGYVDISVAKNQSNDDWDKVKAWLNCDVNGETVRINPVYEEGTDDAKRTFRFYPPLDSSMKLRIGITNNLGGSFWKTYDKDSLPNLAPLPSNGRVIINYTDGSDEQPDNGTFYGSEYVTMNYEVEKNVSAKRKHEIELPFGRKKPIAFLGDGIERNVSIKGSVPKYDDMQTAKNSTLKYWMSFQEQQGVVFARFPDGEHYTALCTGVSIEQDDEYEEFYSVNLTLEEVDI
jgi:hypothetical protein